jgi:hypothetical protein
MAETRVNSTPVSNFKVNTHKWQADWRFQGSDYVMMLAKSPRYPSHNAKRFVRMLPQLFGYSDLGFTEKSD